MDNTFGKTGIIGAPSDPGVHAMLFPFNSDAVCPHAVALRVCFPDQTYLGTFGKMQILRPNPGAQHSVFQPPTQVILMHD